MQRAYLTYRTDNIGDDVQTLALCQELGEPDCYINRDRFPIYADRGEEYDLIANGFFICGPFPPPPSIKPTYVALCASSLNGKDEATIEHLKSCAPVGCRDRHSVRWCKHLGIPHYFASCPSILVQRTIAYDPNGPVVVVDVDPGLLPPIDRPITWMTHKVRPRAYETPERRLQAIQRRLEMYQRASLVITNRLHVGMPCLGMDAPLIMVEANSLKFRLTALPEFVKQHTHEELKEVSMEPSDHRHDARKWRKMVRERLHKRLGEGNTKPANVSAQ